MGLSRLDNFLKSSRGTILYVNPNDLDATDSIENQGNSLGRPFKTIQRALIESARFSYQRGLNNDRFGKTTILIYPGDHIVDNRPGWIPYDNGGSARYRLRDGSTSDDLAPFDLTTNFDLTTPNNALYKLNSVYGGVIIPRGTSIVGLDLRKTKIRPKYVPDPLNDNIERTALFRVTGGCYLWQFSMFDADPNSVCYQDYTSNTFVPNFSHHKLTCFEYADGTNNVIINDTFNPSLGDLGRTDLDMYYEKIGLAYGQASGRTIEPDYPSVSLDIQPKIDEYRIVGSTGASSGISSIFSGDGSTSTTTITVIADTVVDGLDVDTPIRIEGIGESGYNGQFVVSENITASGATQSTIKYQVQNAPLTTPATATGGFLSLQSDTVTSASPYIFNVSLRSVFGMCGVLADGAKASGFKSMVIAQFTGIGLQKDDRAFVVYDDGLSGASPTSGSYKGSNITGYETISTNSRAVFRPAYRNFHIKAINDAFIQNVSVFAIGYAEHFTVESGGDMSITNSNSNFGAKALVATGFRNNAFSQDDKGYITHIIPPKEIPLEEKTVEFDSVVVGIASTNRLYLYNQNNVDVPPENVFDGYRVGARENDNLNVLVSIGGSVTEYTSRIVMPNSTSSSEKSFAVSRTGTTNNISNSIITFTGNHTFVTGESIRILSDNGQIPDGLKPNTVYYAISIASNQIKIAKTQRDALTYTGSNQTNIDINNSGGTLTVVSRVSDKNSGDIGHPIQYDSSQSNWYINVSGASTENTVYQAIVGLGTTSLGSSTPRTYFRRKSDNRNSVDTIYRVRYVIPKESAARPPSDGFILQESNTSIGSTSAEVNAQFSESGALSSPTELRNPRIISNATWSSSTAYFNTELPHNLRVGSSVEINNVISTANTSATFNTGFNRVYSVTGISSAKQFYVGLATDPGTFSNNTSSRTTSLPYFKRKRYNNTYYIYRNQEVQPHIRGEQDGIYHLTVLNASNSPNLTPFTDEKYSQPVKELYPQTNRDNPSSDPDAATSYASSALVGEVYVDDVRKSITKETLNKVILDSDIGVGLTDIQSVGVSTHNIYTEIDHGFNRITKVNIVSAGSSYGEGSGGTYYNARLVGFAGSTTGQHATAKVTVNASGAITAVRIMDGGSAYGIGNTLSVVGIATTTGHIPGYVEVTQIYNNIGDTVRISGITSSLYSDYNSVYRITNVPVGEAKRFTVASASSITGYVSGLGVTVTENAFAYLTGEAVSITSLTYDRNSGIATAVSSGSHGLYVDNKVRLSGFSNDLYNKEWVVVDSPSLTSFVVNIGVGTTAPSAGTGYAYRLGYASNDGVITVNRENVNGRMVPEYAGITTTLLTQIANTTIDEAAIAGIDKLNINIGDYLQVDDEILRVKETVPLGITPPTTIKVFRGVLGTKAAPHDGNSVVRRISIKPTELRRHSIMRASGHTFEYVGFGPGNYSTAFPDKQDRQISAQEELLAQSTRKEGGINFYTGMNDKGISYSGNKKLSTVTGQEEIFDTPIQTVTGEDIGNSSGLNVINPVEGNFSRSIRVEGGSDGKATSEFNGPVIFRNKLTSLSDKGIEANSLFLQGDAAVSKKYTVGISTPILAGNPGDTVFSDQPKKAGYVGWIFTDDYKWTTFGNISLSSDANIGIFDKVGIATTTPGDCTFRVGSGTTLFCVDGTGVGIGTTANAYKLNVQGKVGVSSIHIRGPLLDVNNSAGSAGYVLQSTGTGVTFVNLGSIYNWNRTSSNNGIYNTDLDFVGIGTTVPRFNLEIGAVGSSSTTLYVNGEAKFVGIITANNVFVGGALTSSSYDLTGGTGRINAGIVTTADLRVGTSGTTLYASAGIGSIGIGTVTPRAKLDVEGHARFKTYATNVGVVTVVSNVVTLDLASAQTFTLTADANVTQFTLTNIPSGSSVFTLKILQNGTGGYGVGIDTFRTAASAVIPVYWPGAVVPGVTTTANRSDIYSFMIFDGDNPTTSGIYGVIGGQNFL